ncbi:MAG: pirin family protein [Myxococcaceae bacterium]|jgi:redox-sensitive bicupin YhaK (pirin superfamily)|nr:pirin family protein [Myxococcaceae bacterium]MCA3015742.1 pirin family protein [Myxococcaceae bacterium]
MSARILDVARLGFPWQTVDPFLFCVHHDDAYPQGNDALGPAASLAGRTLGNDFEGRDGWRMYHGEVVPGFPQHPHRGFETVTLARRGFIDHSDSLGATARFGEGDAQWLTAGRGIVHSEMFPLVKRDAANPVELFQLWLNLPRAQKMAEPHFSMLWSHRIPVLSLADERGRASRVTVVAGAFQGATPPPPPPRSWAATPGSDVAIWTLKLSPGASLTLPAAQAGSNRVLYFFRGERLTVSGEVLPRGVGVAVQADASCQLTNAEAEAEVLVLQGRPIGEPVVQYGPFVMNSEGEIRQAFLDYQRTQFGGWPFDRDDPVHPRAQGRFARRPDGRVETPDDASAA